MNRSGLVRRISRRLTGWGRPEAVILAYHRVARPTCDPFGLAVRPEYFAQQLRVLRDQANPLPLADLVAAMERGRVPKRAVVITFDDGYADNLLAACPRLEAEQLPATFFIASGHMGRPQGFWWDDLDRLLLRPRTLPGHVEISLLGQPFRHDLREAAFYSEEEHALYASWKYGEGPEPTPRHRFYALLYPLLQRLPPEPQDEALRDLHEWAGVEPTTPTEDRSLTEEELIQLASVEQIEIGGHTFRHPMLSALTPQDQLREIVGGKLWLEERLGRHLAHFSFPYGKSSAETPALVREAGFHAACSTQFCGVSKRHDLFRLPRICPGDWDGEQFARHLREWFTD